MGFGKRESSYLINHYCEESELSGLLCVFFVFPSSPLSCRFSIFSLLPLAFLTGDNILFSTASFLSEWQHTENAKSTGQRTGWKNKEHAKVGLTVLTPHNNELSNKNLHVSQNP